MNKRDLSEADICAKFITPAVTNAGWKEHSQIQREVHFTKGQIHVRGKMVTRGKSKFADYVLYYKPNIPIAIIEAKDNVHSPATACSRRSNTQTRSTSPSSSPPTAIPSSCMTARERWMRRNRPSPSTISRACGISAATQIGLTATPNETKYVSNIHYFGPPVYTYSLKQGIQDGFLAPYKVINVHIDVDVDGYCPSPGKADTEGEAERSGFSLTRAWRIRAACS